eukprot:3823493-Amphidinium_carterae.2
MARHELGKLQEALADVDQVLVELPDAPANGEAKALKEQLQKKLGAAEKPANTLQAAEATSSLTPGFKRMQIVEASDDEEEEEQSPAHKADAKREVFVL